MSILDFKNLTENIKTLTFLCPSGVNQFTFPLPVKELITSPLCLATSLSKRLNPCLSAKSIHKSAKSALILKAPLLKADSEALNSLPKPGTLLGKDEGK